MNAVLPTHPELRAIAITLIVIAAVIAYVVLEFLWNNRRGR